MSEPRLTESLIQSLGEQLTPVRRLPPPWLRTAGWLLAVVAIAGWLLMHYGTAGLERRWNTEPDMALAGVGAVMTAVCAAWAAFVLGVPGRSARWAWLPLPAALLWIGASGMGCLQEWLTPLASVAHVHEGPACLYFIVSFSVPLSVLLILLLRRACPLRPVRTAVMIGLASAAASAALLEICHAEGAAATDLLMHTLAVAFVVAVNAVMGGRLLQPR